ncbi:1125_t:CDS:2 [Paraglomus occultum]|uniref:aromatase n=1 Tax=Paraglomus occultum TaxID=144539 RepID=A0A9N9GRY1_9GLOM|nr:1125_t:CDS:2 [Paraglomus occultum]
MSSLTLLISSLSFWDVLILFGTFIILYITRFYYSYFTRETPFPGPLPLPLIGNIIQLNLSGDLHNWALENQAKYGDIWEVYIGSDRQLWLARADLVENILTASKDNKYFIRNPPSSGLDIMGMSSNGLIFNRNRERWHFYRKMFAQTLSTIKFSRQATEWVQQAFANMEGYFMELGFDKKVFNFADWMPRFTADMTFRIAMDKHACTMASLYNTHAPSKPAPYPQEVVNEANEFITAFKKFTSTISYFLLTPEIIRTKTPTGRSQTKEHLDNLNWLHKSLIKIIQQRRKEIEKINDNSQLKSDFLTLMITVNTPKDMTQKRGDGTIEEPLTDEDIRASIMEMLLGGIDTLIVNRELNKQTSNLTCFIVYLVITHPEVKARLQQELDTVLGTDLSRPIKYEDLNKLVYTDAVIKETGRLMPATSINLRVAEEDDVIGGYPIKKGQQIIISSLGVQHNSKHWANPKEFNPDRFLEPNNHNIDRYSLEIFGGGMRLCPGRQLAMTEMKTIAALIFRKFDPELATPDTVPKIKYESMNQCYELMLRFKPRKA